MPRYCEWRGTTGVKSNRSVSRSPACAQIRAYEELKTQLRRVRQVCLAAVVMASRYYPDGGTILCAMPNEFPCTGTTRIQQYSERRLHRAGHYYPASVQPRAKILHKAFGVVCFRLSLGSSLLLPFRSACINILGRSGRGAGSPQVGETIDTPRDRSGAAVCRGFPPDLELSTLMNPIATLFLALAMSTDAFAAAIGKGATLHRPNLREALRTGLIFGFIEALTPLIGWFLGKAAAQYVSASDHWIAFGLLFVLGARMVFNGLSSSTKETKPASHSFWLLALTGFATSIDAMAVGASLALVDTDIYSIAMAIGFATTAMVTLGVMLGRVIGHVAGKRAEMAGGVVLIAIGLTILLEHLRIIG
jgi:putative Mn2+ efflux pump MntP